MAASDPRSPGAASNSAPSIGLGSIRMDRLARCPQRGGELVSRRAGSRFVRRTCRSFGAAARTKAQRRLRADSSRCGACGGLAHSTRRLRENCQRPRRLSPFAGWSNPYGLACGLNRADIGQHACASKRRSAAAPGHRGSEIPEVVPSQPETLPLRPGVYKMDWALDGPIPWRALECSTAGTVHLGGNLEEIARSESAVWRGEVETRPFVILAQPSLFDPTRAPEGKHTAWAYCHVPHGFPGPMIEAIEAQIERFAPGFRQRILARHAMSPGDFERHNANLVGGAINGGVHDFRQLLLRPTLRHYSTPTRGLYLCSSSTPPGGGVHGMCGYYAAQCALRDSGLEWERS